MRKILHKTRLSLLPVWMFSAFLMSLFLFTACNDDDDTSPAEESESITQSVTSDSEGEVIALEGSKLLVPPNSIPTLSDGSTSTVSFSIENNCELPEPLPDGMRSVCAVSHFGPEGFIFSDPLWVQFELPEDLNIDQVALVGYLPDTRDYGVFPITYYDEESRTVGTSVYELGYYFLADIDGLTRSRFAASPGGFILKAGDGQADWYPIGTDRGDALGDVWNSNMNYVKLVITDFTPTYPSDYAAWAEYDPDANGGRRYWEFRTPPNVTGWGPNHRIGIKVHGLPQGEYEANLIISHKDSQLDLPECKIYSKPLNFTITGSVICDQFGCDGYDDPPVIPEGGSWMDFNCLQYHPIATEPVCTGEFQATLTWHNGDGDTDLDLRLRGPDGLEVSWENENPGIGGLVLDRDWRYEPGPAQENICAPTLSGMPRGEYELRVDHWGGEDKSFQVRVIADDKSTSYQGQINNGDPDKIIHTFTLD